MKRLGVVENVAYDGSVLIRSAFAPGPGTRVVDKRQRPLGRVVKVFGPGGDGSVACDSYRPS